MAKEPTTLLHIAKALGTSVGTVHRALHDNPGVSAETRARVLETARVLGYRPNLAARFLSSRRTLRVSINTLQGTTSFWDEVRAGIRGAAASYPLENIDLEFRTYPHIGEGEQEAFQTALRSKANGIIVFPSSAQALCPLMRRAARAGVPVVCVATDAPGSGRRGIASVDTLVSGSIAADLMGRFLGGREGAVAITVSDMAISEHAEKYAAFQSTLRTLYPKLRVLRPIEDQGTDAEAFRRFRRLLEECHDLVGVYVTTEASIPVLHAAREAGSLAGLTVITTDLFPDLVPEIRMGSVAATIYQRPRAQGEMAFRMLHKFMVEGDDGPDEVALAPHLVMRGNLDFFLQRQSQELGKEKPESPRRAAPVAAGDFG
jgi:LacI family transcriptional regulator